MWHGSRDSARTPVQWDDSENAGFTTGTPWFYVNENYKEVNVEKQEKEEDSVLNFYRKAIQLRRQLSCVRNGIYQEYNKFSNKLFTYSMTDESQRILVVCSFSDQNENWKVPKGFDLNQAELILCNYKETADQLKPYETRVYLMK